MKHTNHSNNINLSDFLNYEFQKYIPETAFFLGNGINNYCKTTSSWKDLLITLAEEHINQKADFEAILKDNSVTYPEFFDIVQLSSMEDETFDYKSIKKGFKEAFNKWESHKTHQIWTKKIKELNRPILTTNYDFLLEYSDSEIKDFMFFKQFIKKNFRPLRTRKGRAGFTPFYPWHNYYSNQEIKNANNEFAIWHIHGFCEYPSSIRLGLSDYMGIVEKARRWLRKSNGNPFYNKENYEKWVGRNSWLDVFMNNNLLFVGIDIGTHETSLRWLLLEREKLYRQYPKLRKKTWYVIVKGKDKFPMGKKLFFDKLNIKLIEAKSYSEIYKSIPRQI